jgi:hypothetical protein
MNPLTSFEAWYGRDEPPPESVKLKAGHLELDFQDGDLRYIRFNNRELIRRIYVAFRDVNWNTIPGKISNLVIDSAKDQFQIRFDVLHQASEIKFHWQGWITGNQDGIIEYQMNGATDQDLRYCRIGFCILHPIEGIAGSHYLARTPGGLVSGILPRLIEPQRIENGMELPIFPACSSVTITLPDGSKIATDFEGDLFEMEDQRNWTDGSFKTYCTPLYLGYPHQARSGQAFHQKVRVKAIVDKDHWIVQTHQDGEPLQLSVRDGSNLTLPKIGFGISGHTTGMGARKIELLSRLHPDHLKMEVHFKDPDWTWDLERAVTAAKQTGAPLELAIFLYDSTETDLEILKSMLLESPPVRIIIFHEGEAALGTTSRRWMDLVRKYLSGALPGTNLLGGTNGNFAELNRQPPDISGMDGVSYTINPQVHSQDELSLIEALEAQRDTVITAQGYCGSLPICVSSVTFKPPFNQAAIEQESPQDPNELPANVDQRQMSLFAAGWTAGSIRSLAAGGAYSVTYYETIGWRGLMETVEGAPLPQKFRSTPGMVYPLYYVFEFLAKARGAVLHDLKMHTPRLVEGLAFTSRNMFGLLISNLQPCPQIVQINALPMGHACRLRRLNEASMTIASEDPDAFLALNEPIQIEAGVWSHVLEPYETDFVEIREIIRL